MKRTFILMSAFVLLASVTKSSAQTASTQSTFNATGGTAQLADGTEYDWSIGEVALVSTFYGSKIIVTQGLLQNERSTPQKAGNIEFTNHLQVFPNPASTLVNLQYTSSSAGTLSYRLMDMTGKVVMNHSSEIKQGTVTDQLNVSNLANATYMLEVNFRSGDSEAATASYKIEKLN